MTPWRGPRPTSSRSSHGTAPPQRPAAFRRHLGETVEMLRRTTPMRFMWARDYSDYHPEQPGGMRRRADLRMQTVQHVGARSIPVPAASRRHEGLDPHADHRRGLPLDEPDGAGAPQGFAADREASRPGASAACCWAGATPQAARHWPLGLFAGVLRAGIPVWTDTGAGAPDHRRRPGSPARSSNTTDERSLSPRAAESCWPLADSTTAWTCAGSFSPSRSAST